ncbi:MAG: type II toxin-antitoxin system VapC family toxin [Dermatophilaceae bacterium]
MIVAFDSDVLIYAAAAEHPIGERVRQLLDESGPDDSYVGSVLLLPEVLAKPLRVDRAAEVDSLTRILARLQLHPLDEATASLATSLAARYRLKAADAVHLATAVNAGADLFASHNTKDFTDDIVEVRCGLP